MTEEQTKEFVKKSFAITKEYRNKIAHGNRTFSMLSLPQLPKNQLLALTFSAITEKEYNNKMGQNDTMAVLLTLMVMINDSYLLVNLRTELASLFLPYKDTMFNKKTVFEVFNFPNNLLERLDKLIERKFL